MAARAIVVRFGDQEASFGFSKVDRSKLYGRRMRLLLDTEGEACTRAALTADGKLLVRAGMTAQGYFDQEGAMVSSRELVGLDAEGLPLPRVPSTLGVAQDAHEVHASELLATRIQSVYALEPTELDGAMREALEAGKVLEFAFNYRDDFRTERGFLVFNETGFYALIGAATDPAWVDLDAPVEPIEEDDEDDDSLDFGMF
jgi:hypothetical protein